MKIPDLSNALLYFYATTAKNRIIIFANKLKSPTYLLGILLVAYLIFGSPPSQDNSSSRITDPAIISLISTSILALYIIAAWIQIVSTSMTSTKIQFFPFSASEKQILFSAPFSRRKIVIFKLMEGQKNNIPSSILFCVISYSESFSIVRLYLAMYILVNLADIYRKLIQYISRYLTVKKLYFYNWLIVFSIFSIVLYFGSLAALESIRLHNDIFKIFATPTYEAFIYFPKLLLAPAFSQSWKEFFTTIWIPIILLIFLLYIFLHMPFKTGNTDFIYSEGTIKENSSKTGNKKNLLASLSPTGPQWLAIAWKNIVSIIPNFTHFASWILGISIMAIIIANTITLPFEVQFISCSVFILIFIYSTLISPNTIRVGFITDILYFDLIKSMPLQSRQLIFGEIMGPFLILLPISWLSLLLLSAYSQGNSDFVFDHSAKYSIFISLFFFSFCWIFLQLTIQNTIPLYFPRLIKLGRARSQGLDYAEEFIRIIIRFIVLLAFLIIPILFGMITYTLLSLFQLERNYFTASSAYIAASLIVIIEAFVLIYASESRYLRFDISKEHISSEE